MTNNPLHQEHKGFLHWLDRHSVRIAAWFAVAALSIGTSGHLVEFMHEATPAELLTIGFWAQAIPMSLYHTVLFFALEAGSDKTPCWGVDLARVLALVAFLLFTGKALGLIFRSQYDLMRTRGAKGHVIIVGLHEETLAMVRHYREPGAGLLPTRVVVIERDEHHPLLARCRAYGAGVLALDARDPAALRDAGIATARLMICMGPDDENAEIAMNAESVLKDHKLAAMREEKLRILMHINTPGLASRLCISDTLGGSIRSCWFEYFNCAERAVDALLEAHPPFGSSGNVEYKDAHVMVIGNSRQAQLLAAALLNRWSAAEHGTMASRRFLTVVCRDAKVWREELEESMLPADGITSIEFAPLGDILKGNIQILQAKSDLPAPTMMYVFGENDSEALDTALQIQAMASAAGCTGKIVACMNGGEGLSDLVHPIPDEHGRASTFLTFCAREEVCKVLELTLRERIARAVHKNYIADREAEGKTMNDPNLPGMRTWESLSGHFRDDNREQAGFYAEALTLRGWSIVPASLASGRDATLSQFDIDALAEREHARWMKGKARAGYVFGPKRNDVGPQKTHPDMVPYAELSDKTKDYDRRPYARVAGILATEGLGLRKS